MVGLGFLCLILKSLVNTYLTVLGFKMRLLENMFLTVLGFKMNLLENMYLTVLGFYLLGETFSKHLCDCTRVLHSR